MNVKDKVVLITGGGKGIGFGIATAFAKEGAKLAITGRTISTLQGAKQELEEKYGAEVLMLPGDGGDEAVVNGIVKQVVEHYGKLDVLINNAQASKSGTMLVDHTKEDLDLAIYSGIYATFFYMKAAFPYLKEAQGSVINFASSAGFSGKPGQASYAAAKEGVRGLSRVAATEWGEWNINVNVVAPLVMTEQLHAWSEKYPEVYAQTIKNIPMGRFGDAERDIGRLCIFLASEDGKYISGDTISVQGGTGLRP
ncbi:MAG: SDR family oxidoreductase [Pygmaiobacter sp.]